MHYRCWNRGTWVIRNSAPLGPCSRTLHRDLWWPWGGGLFEVHKKIEAMLLLLDDPYCPSISEQLLYRNVKHLRGGLSFKAHSLLYHSTLGSRVIKRKKEDRLSQLDS